MSFFFFLCARLPRHLGVHLQLFSSPFSQLRTRSCNVDNARKQILYRVGKQCNVGEISKRYEFRGIIGGRFKPVLRYALEAIYQRTLLIRIPILVRIEAKYHRKVHPQDSITSKVRLTVYD